MPLQDPSVLTNRGYLENISLKYFNSAYVADEVFPIIDNIGRKVKVGKYQKGAGFRDEAEPRAPGTAARVGYFNMTSVNLDPINYAYATRVSDEEKEEAAKPGNLPMQPENDALDFMADKLDMKREVRTAAEIHAAVWSGVAAGGEDAAGNWGHATAATDTFLADIRTARDTIVYNAAVLPTHLFLSWPAWSKLSIAPALLALMHPSQLTKDSIVTQSALEQLIGMRIIIGRTIKNTAEEVVGDTSFTPKWIWGTSGAETKGIGFVYYRPERPSLKQLSAGYQYRVRLGNGQPRMVSKWREDANHADMYDTQEEVDISAMCLDCGYLFKNTATA
jgi:hypothetical protein